MIMKFVIEIRHHYEYDKTLLESLEEIHLQLKKIIKTMATKEQLQAAFADTQAALASIAASQDNLAGDIERLTERLENEEISEDLLAEAQSIRDRARTAADSLQALADQTPEDDGEEPEPETPTE